MALTTLWIVTADNHDYDRMSQWTVGAFTSKKRADTAAKNDAKEYKRWHKGSGWEDLPLNYEITKVVLNIPNPWGK